MARWARTRYQILISELPGAEPWLLVETAHGTFRLPASAPCWKLYVGARDRWQYDKRPGATGLERVSISAARLVELEAYENAALRARTRGDDAARQAGALP